MAQVERLAFNIQFSIYDFIEKTVLVRRMLNINGRLSLRGTKQSSALGGEIAALRCAAFAMTRVQGAPDQHTLLKKPSFLGCDVGNPLLYSRKSALSGMATLKNSVFRVFHPTRKSSNIFSQ
jgi:hypothetical protein